MITRLGCTHGTAISSSPPKDADFYDLSLLHGAAPKVIWLKGGNCNKAAVTRLLVERSDRIASPVGQEQTTCVEIYDDPG